MTNFHQQGYIYFNKATPTNSATPYEFMGANYIQTTMPCSFLEGVWHSVILLETQGPETTNTPSCPRSRSSKVWEQVFTAVHTLQCFFACIFKKLRTLFSLKQSKTPWIMSKARVI